MDITLKQNLTAGAGGTASWVVGRVGFNAIITLVAIKPVGSVNAASRGAASLSASGQSINSDVDISSAASLASLKDGTHFTVSETDRLTVSLSGATQGNKFVATIHAVPIE